MSSPGPPSDGSSPVERRTGDDAVASGRSLGPPDLVGREPELGRLDRLVSDAAEGRSGVLLVAGEPGVGKTSLLDAARSLAPDFTCLSARGTPAETEPAHAGLLGLLSPLRHHWDDVPAPQAAALGPALGWSAGVPPGVPVGESSRPDRFLVGAATLSLLAAAAQDRPVLVLVDDLQWLDRESASAIVFAARRLAADRVAVVLAARSGDAGRDIVRDLPVLVVGGLGADDASALVPDDVAPAVRGRLVAETGGNPLALLEVVRGLDAAQRVGAAPLPAPLPTGERLLEVYRPSVERLSPGARRAVLVVALGAEPAVGADVDEAVEQGVLVRRDDRIDLRHPLLRSAVLASASASEQRRVHADLAARLPAGSPEQVRHRAASADGPDAALAAELSRVGEEQRARLGHAAASVALERAARLTPDPDLAAHRLADAAQDAFLAGDVRRVRALADRVLRSSSHDRPRGEVLFTLGMLEQYAGSVPVSVEHLDEAAALLEGVALVRALTELALARYRLNDVDGILDCAERIDRAADPASAEQQLLADFCGGVAALLHGDPEGGGARLAEVRRAADLPALRHDPRALLLLALSAGFTGQVRDAVAVGAGRIEEVRRRGALGVLVPVLAILAAGRAWLGDHDGAFADAGEAADLATHLGYAADASVAVEMLAWQQAARGLHDEARVSLTRARALVERAGTSRFAAHHALTAAFCALCRGEVDEVVALLEPRLALDGGVGASGEPLGVAPLLVEGYVASGRLADARDLAARHAEVVGAHSPPLDVALSLRCAAMTAEDGRDAVGAFEAALAVHERADDPFEEARTRLLHGSRLRRSGRRTEARTQLEVARGAFAAMNLTHWAELASSELAGTGMRRGSPAAGAPLTSQETRVALLVARGLTNREIAAALFLSPKTIERHVSNVFRKRGLRSRAELAAAFARSSADGG